MYPAKPGLLIGFHGCDKSVRDRIINNQSMLYESNNDYDWLGNGMYFWENNRARALEFAQNLQRNPQGNKTHIQNPSMKPTETGEIIFRTYLF
jgi:hypothetical protein